MGGVDGEAAAAAAARVASAFSEAEDAIRIDEEAEIAAIIAAEAAAVIAAVVAAAGSGEAAGATSAAEGSGAAPPPAPASARMSACTSCLAALREFNATAPRVRRIAAELLQLAARALLRRRAAAAAEAAAWSTHRTTEGKRFYYNRLTKQRVWRRPDALRTPTARASAGLSADSPATPSPATPAAAASAGSTAVKSTPASAPTPPSSGRARSAGPSAPPAPSPMPAAAALTAADEAAEWSAHRSPDGKKFYYNKRTKQRVWRRPDALRTPTATPPHPTALTTALASG